jgi:hypothetical protein
MRDAKVVACALALSFFLVGCGGKSGGSLVGIPNPNTNAHGAASSTPTGENTNTPGPLASITVTPNDVKMAIGQSIVFTAHGVDANNHPVPILQPHWSCDPGAGQISNTGQFTAKGAGWFQPGIIIESGGIQGAVNLNINVH